MLNIWVFAIRQHADNMGGGGVGGEGTEVKPFLYEIQHWLWAANEREHSLCDANETEHNLWDANETEHSLWDASNNNRFV